MLFLSSCPLPLSWCNAIQIFIIKCLEKFFLPKKKKINLHFIFIKNFFLSLSSLLFLLAPLLLSSSHSLNSTSILSSFSFFPFFIRLSFCFIFLYFFFVIFHYCCFLHSLHTHSIFFPNLSFASSPIIFWLLFYLLPYSVISLFHILSHSLIFFTPSLSIQYVSFAPILFFFPYAYFVPSLLFPYVTLIFYSYFSLCFFYSLCFLFFFPYSLYPISSILCSAVFFPLPPDSLCNLLVESKTIIKTSPSSKFNWHSNFILFSLSQPSPLSCLSVFHYFLFSYFICFILLF